MRPLSELMVIDPVGLKIASSFKGFVTYYERDKTIKRDFTHKASVWINKPNLDYIEFRRLVQNWKEYKKYISSLSDITNNEAYKKIIEKGKTFLNYIIVEMKSDPDYWFDALKQITKKDPVKPEHWGSLEEMTKDWLGYLEK
jgi:hypothetical protein